MVPFHLSDPFSTAWQWLQNAEAIFTFAILISGWVAWSRIKTFISLRQYRSVGDFVDSRRGFRGMVFLISRPDQALWIMGHHNVGAIGIVYTEQSKESAETVRKYAVAQKIHVSAQNQLNDPESVMECLRIVRSQLNGFGDDADPSGLAVDVTGGKTPMSLGAFMAANEFHVEAVYLSHHVEGKTTIPDRLITMSRP